MKIFTLRVIPDVKDTVYRDVEIGGNQSLEALHQSIVRAFELDGKQMASFFETDDFWDQKMEIPMIKITDEDSNIMSDLTVAQLLHKVDDKLLYIYDFLLMRQFFVEVMEIDESKQSKNLPRVVKRYGDSPKVSKSVENAENAESILLEALLGADFSKELDEFEDESKDEDDWDNLNDIGYDDLY